MVLESKYGSPRIVNDGVTVAKEVELEDPVENIGAKLVRQARRPSMQDRAWNCHRVVKEFNVDHIVKHISAALVR